VEAKENSSSEREKEIVAIDREIEELEAMKPVVIKSEPKAWEKLRDSKVQNVSTSNFDTISARELQTLDIAPLEFIVDNFLPLGLGVLGAPAKSFKSYMCLDMTLCICKGFDFLGIKTKKCSCLYLDLESTRRRPKNRVEQILKGKTAPDNLYIATQADLLGNGFEVQLRKEKEKHPDIKVVIVDVFKKIRPSATKNKDPYERDYEDYGKIKALADELDIAILLVTHTTKMKHPDDPFNELTGSAGVMGSIDVAMVIKKDKREDETAKLYITGRDLEEQCYEMKFNKSDYKWNMMGKSKDMDQLRKELEYKQSPIIGTIRKLVEQNQGKWKGTASEIISASQYFNGLHIYDTKQQVGQKINEFVQLLKDYDCIEFHRNSTSKTNEYEFTYNNPFVSTVSTDSTLSTVSTDSTE
jgi:RecA-family ATPase